MEIGIPSASHFIFIPTVLLIGVVIGWILGSRAAQDAIASERRKAEGRRQKAEGAPKP
jgi:hypothetical protein